ncbi:MAG: hypothetical protein EAZ30_02310 [Betaproteobacteria bacterium]|nr:MAG: hypothetical protein EAZ43_04535 [Betaproteobacteria bacterium]TAG49690.1 MAG: hypothetical protein EAZ30_02310 [Betaproteobacteria bacterium]TAG82207.1 MAG: hypothetical protein EAZ21_04040 [Betaproteobacteria bacterium]
MADLLTISGYTRDQMRGLLDALPMYSSRNTRVRVAKQYTAQDLLLVRTCVQLEVRYGLQRITVAGFSEQLRAVLSGPRPLSSSAHLLLTFEPINVRYVDDVESLQEGLLVPLAPIFQTVDEYLLPGRGSHYWNQRELGFGPQAVGSVVFAPTTKSVVRKMLASAGNMKKARSAR